MAVKGSSYKRLYQSKLIPWLISSGISGGVVVGLIFFYLASAGAIDIINYTPDYPCVGTEDNPCEAIITFKALKDVYIYPFTESDDAFQFEPSVKSWKLYRSWGSGWRTIYLNQTWNKNVKYAIKFSAGNTYTVKVQAVKFHPSDSIKWGFTSDLDPVFEGVGEEEISFEGVLNPDAVSNADPNIIGYINNSAGKIRFKNDYMDCEFVEQLEIAGELIPAGGKNTIKESSGTYKVNHYIPVGKTFEKTGKFVTDINCNKEITANGNGVQYVASKQITNEFGKQTDGKYVFLVDYSVEKNNFIVTFKQLDKDSVRVIMIPKNYSMYKNMLVIDPFITEFDPYSFTSGTFDHTINQSVIGSLTLEHDAGLILKFDENKTNSTDFSIYQNHAYSPNTSNFNITNKAVYGRSLFSRGTTSTLTGYYGSLNGINGNYGSYELWLNVVGDCGNTSSFTTGANAIFRVGDNGANDYNDVMIYGPSNAGDRFLVFKGDTNSFASIYWNCSNWTADSWHHMVVTWNTSDNLTLYVDGIREGVDIDDETAITTSYTIGQNDATNSQSLVYLDNIIVYNRVLNRTDVIERYNGSYARADYFPRYYQNGSYVSYGLNATDDVVDWTTVNWTGAMLGENKYENNHCYDDKVTFCVSFDEDGSDISVGQTSSTVVNADTSFVGIVNRSMYFNGQSYIEYTHKNASKLPDNQSISLWFYNEKNVLGSVIEEFYNTNYYYGIYACPGNKAAYIFKVAGGYNSGGYDVTLSNDWHNVFVTYDTYNGSRLYIDGEEKQPQAITGCVGLNLDYGPMIHAVAPFHIGSRQRSTLNFTGYIDNVMIYNRTLSPIEVKQIVYDQSGTYTKIRAKSSNDNTTFGAYGEYSDVSYGDVLDTTDSQFIKYQFNLGTGDTYKSPQINNLTINYNETLATNCTGNYCSLQWEIPGVFQNATNRWFVVYFDINTSYHTLPSYTDRTSNLTNATLSQNQKNSNYAFTEYER